MACKNVNILIWMEEKMKTKVTSNYSEFSFLLHELQEIIIFNIKQINLEAQNKNPLQTREALRLGIVNKVLKYC